MAKRLTEIVTKLVGIKKERMWTMSSTLIWSLTIRFFTKTKAPVHAGRERAAETSLRLAQGSPSSGVLWTPGPPWPSGCSTVKLPVWVCTKNYQRLCFNRTCQFTVDEITFTNVCHITSLTSQRFSEPLSQPVVDLHMATLWLLLTPQ